MAFSCGFFDSKNKDRVYTAENFTRYLSSLVCDGILDTYGQCFSITAHNNLTVTIGTGKAWIKGHYFENDAGYTLDLSSYVSASQTQYALIGICCDTSNNARECSIVVKTGAAASSISNGGSQTYLTLAAVRLSAGTHMVVSGDITDYRDDDRKCGYVKCILGKCGVSDLLERLSELEERAAVLEELLGVAKGKHRAIAYRYAATGLTALVGHMDDALTGLIGIVGQIETTEVLEVEDE